jgi:N-acetylglucosamine kinase-like BadF-type ATPase
VGLEGTYEALQQAVDEALRQTGATPAVIAAAAYGLGGLDWPSDEERLRPIVERLGVGGPQVLVNDAFAALRAGASWGIAVIAGTGTTCAGRNLQGETARTLGLGTIYDDWGSAPQVAGLCVRAVAQAYTGRGPITSLTDRLTRLFGARDAAELLEGLSRGRYDLDSQVAAVIQALAGGTVEGDEAAVQASWHSGRELGERAGALAQKLGMAEDPCPVILAGGLFRTHNPVLLEALEHTIRNVAPAAHLEPLKAPPVVGSALMAMDIAGVKVTAEAHRQLAAEAQHTLNKDGS